MENILVYHIGDIPRIISLSMALLITTAIIGFIIPRGRKQLRDAPTWFYRLMSGASALTIGALCFLDLFDLIGYKFEQINAGTSESLAWAPIEAIVVIEAITIVMYGLMRGAFKIGKNVKLKVI